MKNNEDRKPKTNRRNKGVDRRSFVKLLPAAGAAGIAVTKLDVSLAAALQQPQASQTPQRVTKEMLHAAEQLIGIELSDAQETTALQGVNQNLNTDAAHVREFQDLQ